MADDGDGNFEGILVNGTKQDAISEEEQEGICKKKRSFLFSFKLMNKIMCDKDR